MSLINKYKKGNNTDELSIEEYFNEYQLLLQDAKKIKSILKDRKQLFAIRQEWTLQKQYPAVESIYPVNGLLKALGEETVWSNFGLESLMLDNRLDENINNALSISNEGFFDAIGAFFHRLGKIFSILPSKIRPIYNLIKSIPDERFNEIILSLQNSTAMEALRPFIPQTGILGDLKKESADGMALYEDTLGACASGLNAIRKGVETIVIHEQHGDTTVKRTQHIDHTAIFQEWVKYLKNQSVYVGSYAIEFTKTPKSDNYKADIRLGKVYSGQIEFTKQEYLDAINSGLFWNLDVDDMVYRIKLVTDQINTRDAFGDVIADTRIGLVIQSILELGAELAKLINDYRSAYLVLGETIIRENKRVK